MRKLGLDVGLARIGVATSMGSLAIPHSAITNNSEAVKQVVELYHEVQASCCYIGLPLSLSGTSTKSTAMALDFARLLSGQNLPVRMIDERLTTRSAASALRDTGKNSKQQKSLIDASAATVILEFALSSERDGNFSGKSLEEFDA